MSIAEHFPIYNKLTKAEQEMLDQYAVLRKVPQGTLVHGDGSSCIGLLILRSGQFRAYMTSDEGKEITLYRLFDQDICLFSASCIMTSIQFDIMIMAEKDTEFWAIPPYIFKKLSENNVHVANYTNQLMSTRFTDVMWLVEQIMWKSFDKRLAAFLLEECSLEGTQKLQITHEKIAAHLGTAREVVTRMLRYFQSEGMVALSRGTITVTDEQKLQTLCE